MFNLLGGIQQVAANHYFSIHLLASFLILQITWPFTEAQFLANS